MKKKVIAGICMWVMLTSVVALSGCGGSGGGSSNNSTSSTVEENTPAAAISGSGN